MNRLISAAGSDPEEKERGSTSNGKKKKIQYVEKISHFSYKTQSTVVGGKIKDARNYGYVFFSCALFVLQKQVSASMVSMENNSSMSP